MRHLAASPPPPPPTACLPPTPPPPSPHPHPPTPPAGAAGAHALLEVVPLVEEEVGREVLVLVARHEGLQWVMQGVMQSRTRENAWMATHGSVHALRVVPMMHCIVTRSA